MVEVSLEAYSLQDTYTFNEIDALKLLYITIGTNINYTSMGYTQSDIDNLESTYGIKFKYLWGYTASGQYTQGYIVSWDSSAIRVFNWSNGSPKLGSFVYLKLVQPTTYINEFVDSVDLGLYLKDDTLTIKQQFESLKIMDLRVSRASFEVIEFPELTTFMNKYWTADKYNDSFNVIGVHIKEDGVGKFWGYTTPDTIIYDPEFKTYSFDTYDWIKFFLDTKGKNTLYDEPSPNLYDFLYSEFFPFGDITIDVGSMNQTWSKDDWNYILEDGQLVSIEHEMTMENLFIEALKYYGAYAYYSGDKALVFKNRNVRGSIFDVSKIISGTFTKAYRIKDYDSLLINVSGDWILNSLGNYEHYEGWALIWSENGELKELVVNGDESNIPKEKNFLDLRQKIPYETFEYRMFSPITREEVYEKYRTLLEHTECYYADLAGTNYEIMQECKIDNISYLIKNCEIDYGSNSTKVLLERYNGN